MAVVHISEAEAARDFASLISRVRAGEEIVIESGQQSIAMQRVSAPHARTLSECITLAKKHELESGEAPVLDPDFAADVEKIIRNRDSWNPPAWE